MNDGADGGAEEMGACATVEEDAMACGVAGGEDLTDATEVDCCVD